MASVLGFLHRTWLNFNPPTLPKADNALKFGILGAANIAPIALIGPAKHHPEVIIQAVAARDRKKAEAYAKKHHIPQVLDSYDAILDDPAIDAVYIPLPNGLHFEWTLKALAKGKHVLLEKPSVSNAEEAGILFNHPLLKQPNAPVLVEAWHYRFQPAWQYFVSLIDHANVEHARSWAKFPTFLLKPDDIRFQYSLAGGAMMDFGVYPMSTLRGVFAAEPEACLECTVETMPEPYDELCDHTFKARYKFPNGGVGEIDGSLRATLRDTAIPTIEVTHRSVVVPDDKLPEGQEKTRVRKIKFVNYVVCCLYHRIEIEDTFTIKDKKTDKVVKTWKTKEIKKIYTFKDAGIDQPSEIYWMSYRHQLEQFVNRVRGREGSGLWFDHESSIGQMRMVDMTYEKSKLPLRPTSEYRLDSA